MLERITAPYTRPSLFPVAVIIDIPHTILTPRTGTARVIRHAVGIDERRAKFRQDLVERVSAGPTRKPSFKSEALLNKAVENNGGARRASANGHGEHQVYQNRSSLQHHRFSSSHERLSVTGDKESVLSLDIHAHADEDDEDERAEQDIQEVWFPGAHGDIGGGWDLPDGEESLSHGPLVWMVSEKKERIYFFIYPIC